MLHHCSGGCGAAPLAQVAGFRSSRGPPCFGGHGRQYRQYRQFRQYRQRQWAGRQRLGTRPPTGYVPVPLDGVPVIGAFAHLREVDLPRLGLSAEVVGGATAVHAAAIGGAGSRTGGCGGTPRPNPLPVGTFAGPLVAGGAGRDHPSHLPPTRLWRVPSLSLSQRERGLGMRSPTVTFAYPRCGGSGRPRGAPLREGSGFPEFTNEVQHQIRVLPWDTDSSRLRNDARLPAYVPRAPRSGRSLQLWIARHRRWLGS